MTRTRQPHALEVLWAPADMAIIIADADVIAADPTLRVRSDAMIGQTSILPDLPSYPLPESQRRSTPVRGIGHWERGRLEQAAMIRQAAADCKAVTR